MLVLALLTDPISGEIQPPMVAWLLIVGSPAVILIVFYIEFQARHKHASPAAKARRVGIKSQLHAPEPGGRGKC